MKYELAPPLSHNGPLALWDASQDYTRILLRDLQVEAKVGLHAWEQHPERPTRLVVNIELFAPVGPGKMGADESFIDYDRIRDAIRAWPRREHVLLLETLVEELVALCFEEACVAACRVSILKPDIFNEAAAVGVELYRRRPVQARP